MTSVLCTSMTQPQPREDASAPARLLQMVIPSLEPRSGDVISSSASIEATATRT
jgi:hypothetical protein